MPMSSYLDKKKYVALICARGGSQGLPKKNIRELKGRPLIGWAINTALQISRVERVIVSTDSQEIANVALEFGAEVPFLRPTELAQHDSPEWLVWQHLLQFIEKDTGLPFGLLVLPTTSPLRAVSDVERCLDEYEKGTADTIITTTMAHRNPSFNMIKQDDSGFCSILLPPDKTITRRQDAPTVYDMTTVAFVSNPHFVLKHKAIFDGRVRAVLIPHERSIDIDTEFDFKIAEIFADTEGEN